MRTPLADRKLPDYTRQEEVFNMTSHIVGGGFGILVTIACVVTAALRHDGMAVIGGAVYGAMMIFLYTISSIYHGLVPEGAKKVFQVLDHCTIYALILGTYIPILLTGLWDYSRKISLVILAVVTVGTIIGVTFTAIDFHHYRGISYACYFVVGWSALFAVVPIVKAFGWWFFAWILAGGCFYTFGMIFFTKGIKQRWYHGVFHIFILLGSIFQFVGIYIYCILH